MTASSPSGPLSGVRVLDLSKILAGPLCTQYMADMGAEVLKIEPVVGGDDTRTWPPFVDSGLGGVFLSANRGKQSIALDLKNPKGRQIALSLAEKADVVIESYGKGVAERLGVHEKAIREINPDVIYCSISGFGSAGPLREAPGYDVVLQAYCGIMALTGNDDGMYMRSPISPIDQMTGMHALTGILAALYARQLGKGGELVETSLFETAMGLMAYNLQSYWISGAEPRRAGSTHESLCPYQVFETADGPLLLAVANDAQWSKFCDVAGLEHLAKDARFSTNPARVANRSETVDVVARVLSSNSAGWWVEQLHRVRVPCAPINGPAQLLQTEQARQSGMILSAESSNGKPIKSVAHPVRFGNSPRRTNLAAPLHGENAREVLEDLGFTQDAINDLHLKGIVAGQRAPD